MHSRFSQDQYGLMKVVECCCQQSNTNYLDQDLLHYAASLYGFKIADAECEVFRSFMKRFEASHSLLDMFEMIDKNVFPSMHKLFQILLTIPQTLVNVERMFSSVKRIKSRLGFRMTTERLCSLSLLSIEKDLSKSIDREAILAQFKKIKNRRCSC